MHFNISQKTQVLTIKAFRTLGATAGISIICGTLTIAYFTSRPQSLPITYTFTHNNHIFYLESATEPNQLQKGLSYRKNLDTQRGMLFNLGRTYKDAPFWMYKVNFPLDIIFLNQGIVTKVVHNAPPCHKQPCPIYIAPIATHVLELNAGTAKSANIQLQDKLHFQPIDTNFR